MTQTATPPAPNVSQPLGVSLKTDRIEWIRQTATANGITVSELVRRCVDAGRKDPKRIGL